MSRYRSYGKLDDPFVTEGDTFFLRMNARLRPNQLKPGEVALSKNGRMNDDGTWQTRKGLSTLFGSITSGTDAIRLPYVIQSASRSLGVVTIVLNSTPSLLFLPSDNITIAGLSFTGDDPNGTFALSTVNFTTKTITYASAGADETFTVFGDSQGWGSINSNWSSITTTYLGLTLGSVSVCSAGNSIATTLNFTLNDDGVNAVFGSAVYSDASSNSDDFIFTATNNLCIILRLKDLLVFKSRYDAGGETVDGSVGMTQGFDKMFIFRTNKTTLSASPKLNQVAISSASQSGQTITVNTSTNHGRVTGDFVTLTNLGNWTVNPNDCYEITRISDTQFTVTMDSSQTATFNVSGAQVEYFADFTSVPSGTYTAPQYLTDTTTTASSGLVTMDVPTHGLSVGDLVTIRDGQSPYDLFKDQSARVNSATTNQFTFNLGVEDVSVGQSLSLTVSKQLAIGKGFIHQPAAPFGEFHQRRLWLPFQYTSDTLPTDREIRDEIAVSDIFDSDTFDIIGNQFRTSSGKSDFLVGIKGFTQDSVVAFNRKSIHLLTGASGSLADVKTTMVTDEVGAIARKSIIQVANQFLFLSDRGIFGISFLDEYNLRGTGTPLSEPIQPFIDRINQNYAHLSTGVYFDSRYWLAVPLDSSPGAGDTTKLNTIIIYSFINGGFESIDSVNSTEFGIRDLLVAREGAQNALYLTTEEGGIHKVDSVEGDDLMSLTAGQSTTTSIPVISQLTTRQYDADSMDRKNFSRAEFHVKSNNGFETDGNLQFITEDPDSTTETTSISTLLGSKLPSNEEASIRLRVRKRGFGVQADFQPTDGRPYLRSSKVDARIADRSTTSVS